MSEQSTAIPKKRTVNCRGILIDLSTPAVMGILNVTPDSFFDGGQYNEASQLIEKAKLHLQQGASILDIGAVSTRPNASEVTEAEEMERLIPAVTLLREKFPTAILSVDTYRSSVARAAIHAGADMINDISGGQLDENMFTTIAALQVPYVLMHMQGTPQTMQDAPHYDDVTEEVLSFFVERVDALHRLGVHDVIVDPGFGFGKTVEHNYQLLRDLERFQILGVPMLCGFSRKSMINKVIGTSPDRALNGTTVLNTMALERGVDLLRVHDVKEAVEAVKICGALSGQSTQS
ncbi:MAG: dihydropteroate synthase [Flavobacteriales bacterium]|nr:dihydropteroate synthase [Flavobacteriales bacterium]